MKVPSYDIFRGARDKDAVWVETVVRLGAAQERMKELAKSDPGPYFIFSLDTHSVLASIDTTPPENAKERESA